MGDDPNHLLDEGFGFRIRHYWEIRKVINGHKSAAAIHTDSPDGGSGYLVTFSRRSRTGSSDVVIDIATLVRRVLAEVCAIPVLLVC